MAEGHQNGTTKSSSSAVVAGTRICLFLPAKIRNFFHFRAAIEKGRLIDILNQPTKGFTPMAGEPIPSYSLVGKDIKLLSLPGGYRKRQVN
ncbi:hypothetical protein [Porphyromonas miyakawae]|uniref:hypothetical protein n=1 Tax=Porphyromonas miyakawae TaxID=3137470 RepID=UPI00398C618E